MSQVSVREFSYNPSAIFSRAEHGETLEITRHGTVIAVLVPGGEETGKYAPLAASGKVHFRPRKTTGEPYPRYESDVEEEPIDALIAMREAEER